MSISALENSLRVSLGYLAVWGQAERCHPSTAGPPGCEGSPGSLQPNLCSGQGHLKGGCKGIFLNPLTIFFLFNQVLNISKDGDSTTLGILFLFLATIVVKNAFSYASLEFPMFMFLILSAEHAKGKAHRYWCSMLLHPGVSAFFF